MSDPCEILDQLREAVGQIDRSHPPGLVWIRNEVMALLASPRIRRVQRNAYIVELAGHYASHGATARALAHYGSCVWPRHQHLTAPPLESAERQLMWQIYAVGLPVPITQQGISLVMAEVPHDKDTVVPCDTLELASITEA